MKPKQKANIVSWVCLGILWSLLITSIVFMAQGQMNRVGFIIPGFMIVLRFDKWYCRRQEKSDREVEPPAV